MKVLGRDAKREFTEPLTVSCRHPTAVTEEGVTLCGRTATMTIGERNDPAHPGKHCDGQYGSRHPIALMVGPRGKSYE